MQFKKSLSIKTSVRFSLFTLFLVCVSASLVNAGALSQLTGFRGFSETFRRQAVSGKTLPLLLASPTVTVTTNSGPPFQAYFRVQDADSGLQSIVVTQSDNADTVVPPFTVGTTDPVMVTSTKIDQTQPLIVILRVTDVQGNLTTYTYTDAVTAALVSISGRVTTSKGRGILNVRLTLTDSNGEVRTARTTSSGYYQFTDVEVGQTYVLSAAAKHYTFSQPVRVINANQETDAVDFVADSENKTRGF